MDECNESTQVMKNNTKYIVFDGMDGSGKGTQMKLLQEKFNTNTVFTREPGGAPLAEEIRKIVLDNPLAKNSTALFHFLSFWAAREESIYKLVMPALLSGKHVFSDRGDSSTFAFQLYGEEYKQELFEIFTLVRKLVFSRDDRRDPDQYIIFDLPPKVARERVLQDADRKTNHFDTRDIRYYKRVREGFCAFEHFASVKFIDATQSPEEVHKVVLNVLHTLNVDP